MPLSGGHLGKEAPPVWDVKEANDKGSAVCLGLRSIGVITCEWKDLQTSVSVLIYVQEMKKQQPREGRPCAQQKPRNSPRRENT